jgi:tripartite-type tricarboxylate transporter receptor subunit TctC
VPGYESSFWTGVGAPKDTPAEIIDKLNGEINAALADPQFKGAPCRSGRYGVVRLAC